MESPHKTWKPNMCVRALCVCVCVCVRACRCVRVSYICNFLKGLSSCTVLNSLDSTGIFTVSPSGIQTPCEEINEIQLK